MTPEITSESVQGSTLRPWQIILALVPLVVAFLLSLYALALDESARHEQVYQDLDRKLQELLGSASPENFLQHRFRRLAWLSARRTHSPDQMVQLWKSARKHWSVAFEPYWFDSGGRLLTPAKLRVRQPLLVEKIWRILRTDPNLALPGSEALKKDMEDLFGLDFQTAHLKDVPGRVFSVISHGQEGLAFWSPDGKPGIGGMFLVAWRKPTTLHLLKLIAKKGQGNPCLAAADKSGRFTWLNHFPRPQAFRQQVTNRFLLSRERFCIHEDRLWAKAGSENPILFGGVADSRLDSQTQRQRVQAFFFLLAPGMLFFLYLRFMAEGTAFFSIRRKLILLFIFALIIPLSGVMFLGFRTLHDRQVVILAEGLRAAGELLAKLDAAFVQEAGNCLKLFREARDKCRPGIPPVTFKSYFEGLQKQKKIARSEIHNLDGSTALLVDSANFDKARSLFDAFAKLCIDRQLTDRLEGIEKPPQSQEAMVMRMMVESPEMGFMYISDRPDRIHELKFGNYHTYLYWDAFHDPTHPAAYISLIQLVKSVFEKYLETSMGKAQNDGDQRFTLLARDNKTNRLFPTNFKPEHDLLNFMDKARTLNQGLGERMMVNGAMSLVFALPGLNLEGYTLCAYCPEHLVLSGLYWLKLLIFLGILLTIILAILSGLVLSDTFLYPIGELSKGIAALRERDVSHRIPELPQDELGDLGLTFNRMIVDMKEMELARVVQEALLPKHAPDVPGYDLSLSIETASDLGGDYCDILPLKNGQILLVIGDVTGHGVSSALLVAMAKAIVFQFVQTGGSCQLLLGRLNHLIYQLLKKKKMMTFFVAMLDPESGSVHYSNAGHPYPVFSSADGQVRMLESINLPLGATSRKVVYKEDVLTLGPGETLVFYTDGLVEALDEAAMPFGYDRLTRSLKGSYSRSSLEIQRTLLEDFRRHNVGPNLEDDVTLVIVKRRG